MCVSVYKYESVFVRVCVSVCVTECECVSLNVCKNIIRKDKI